MQHDGFDSRGHLHYSEARKLPDFVGSQMNFYDPRLHYSAYDQLPWQPCHSSHPDASPPRAIRAQNDMVPRDDPTLPLDHGDLRSGTQYIVSRIRSPVKHHTSKSLSFYGSSANYIKKQRGGQGQGHGDAGEGGEGSRSWQKSYGEAAQGESPAHPRIREEGAHAPLTHVMFQTQEPDSLANQGRVHVSKW